jgi:glyoxylase-like metal-dependent hydrolase (beta-lactamase superfamily II)
VLTRPLPSRSPPFTLWRSDRHAVDRLGARVRSLRSCSMPAPPLALQPTDIALSDHVTVLVGAKGGKYPDGNATLVVGPHGALVIDPSLTVHARGGTPTSVDRALVSHAHEDHMAGVGILGPDVSVHMHERDVLGIRSLPGLLEVYGMPPEIGGPFSEMVVDEFHYTERPDAHGFADGDVFDLGGGVTVRVVHLAGHTYGHCGFVIEPDGVAFIGDIDLTSFGPYYGDHWSDLDQFVVSLAVARELDARHWVTFHQKGVVSDRTEYLRMLDAFASVIDRRDDTLLGLLTQPRTFDELVDHGVVYRKETAPSFAPPVERRTIELHLARLMREDRVEILPDGAYLRRM